MTDRQDAYLALVRDLLEREGGTETDILATHRELVDERLVMTLRGVAQAMAAENDPERKSTIKWLRGFATQLAQALEPYTDSNSEDTASQLNFLMTVFQAIAESIGNPQVIYPLFRDNLAHLNESLIPILAAWNQTIFAEVDEDGKQFLAAVMDEFANLIQQFPLGNRLINLEIVTACYELALSVYTQDAYPEDWATTQNNLANTYSDRIRGERAANLELSIGCYELALSVHTPDAYPEDWAMTQNNLGTAYRARIRGERAANLELAIECYELALSVRTLDAYPEDWAGTQNNLAIAYGDRIRGERAANLERSFECYELALSVYTQDAYPEKWAGTQNNLANAYRERIWGERAANLELAIECSELALSVYTHDTYPEDWAGTQMNLANTYSDRIRGKRAANLERSFECCKLALSVYTLDAYPEKWAGTQNNLAIAYSERIRGERAANLERSFECYELALSVRTLDAYPEQWAGTQNNLAILYAEDGKNEQAIRCYEQALIIFTPENFPINALKASRGLGKIYFAQGECQLAVNTYAVAIEAAETSRNWAKNEDERQRIMREAISVYQYTIQAYINLGQIDLAITTSERARSRQLVDFMHTNDLYPQGRVPEKVKEYVAVTKALQQHRQTDLPANDRSLTTSRSHTRSDRAAALETKRQNILQEIRQEDAIAAGQMEVIPIDLPTIQALITTANTAILSFYTTDDDTHIFIITQAGEPQIFTLPEYPC
jgi:tetratricopeptide (TPR) repeat protein